MQLETRRLLIRPWRPADRPAYAATHADREVRRYYYPPVLTRAGADEEIDFCLDHLNTHGFAFLAVTRREDGVLIGGAGLSHPQDLPFSPAVEIGFILGRPFWRQGYASEASRAWFAHAWSIGLPEIVGYTSQINAPSRALMQSLGMTCDRADDFPDPTVPPENPLSPHVLYRLRNPNLFPPAQGGGASR